MIPTLRLSGFYLFYFTFLGALVPYWSLYLQSFEFEPRTIGLLMGMLYATRILAPSLWGWLADVSGQRMRVVRFGALATWLVFALIFWQSSALGIALVTLGFSFFWNAILPQFEVVTLHYLGARREGYSRIRVWGSIGFIGAVLVLGYLLDQIDIRWLPLILLLLLVLIWLDTLLVAQGPIPPEATTAEPARLMQVLRHPEVIAFFLVCFLIQFGHGPYYSFYSPLLVAQGYSRTLVGLLWGLGVAAEVVLFFLMPRVLARWSLRQIMLVSLGLSALRWGIIAQLPEQMPLMLFAQLLHAASYGSLHIVGIALVQHYFPVSLQGRGQALYSSLGFGVGGLLGAVVAGYLWGDGRLAFGVAVAANLLALVLATVWIYPEKAQQNHH